jgi:hypothetical protein
MGVEAGPPQHLLAEASATLTLRLSAAPVAVAALDRYVELHLTRAGRRAAPPGKPAIAL